MGANDENNALHNIIDTFPQKENGEINTEIKKIAVISPVLGVPSETFIKRHMSDLCPGRTAVIVKSRQNPPAWDFSGPFFELDQPKNRRREPLPFLYRKPKKNLVFNLKKFLKQNKIQTVLAEYMDFSLKWFGHLRNDVERFYVHAHGFDISVRLSEPEWAEKYKTWNDADGIIAPSLYAKKKLEKIGLDPQKIKVIPCGVDIPADIPLKSESSTIRCLAVGRMVQKKGPLFLLKAFKGALDSFSGLFLDYAGDGPLMPDAVKFVQENKLEKKVTFHGVCAHEKILKLLKDADIFLQHSITDPDNGDQEGLPVAILEAMAYGLPVISTVHAGIPEAVIDGVTGLLTAEGAINDMTASINHLAQSFEKRIEMGLAGRRAARENFSWDLERQNLRTLMGLND